MAALELKTQGNEALAAGHYSQACALYSQAIEIDGSNHARRQRPTQRQRSADPPWASSRRRARARGAGPPRARGATRDSARARRVNGARRRARRFRREISRNVDAAAPQVLYSNRAMAHIKAESYGLAISDAEAAIRIDPTYIKAYYRRGSANFALGKYRLALRDFKAVCKLRPSDRDARTKLKECEKAMVVEDAYDGPRLGDDGVMTDEFVEGMLERFRDQRLVHKKYVLQILLGAKALLQAEGSLVDLKIPETDADGDADKAHYTVCGDVHGQFYDLLHIFEINGLPSAANPYVFNGDFVDRGSFSVEVVTSLFALKLRHPGGVHLNRGNHETKNMTKIYGRGEVRHKYDATVLALFHECFCFLPLAACIESKVFVTHGGLSSDDGVVLDDVRAIDRDREPPDAGLMCDLLWSDPQANEGRSPSKRGVGLSFGPDVTRSFLAKNDLRLVIRSHEVRDSGYELEHGGDLITVFSAPNYCDAMGNKGAFVHLHRDLDPKFTTFDAVPHPPVRPRLASSPFGL
ncbi:hypothetical protein JL722_8400 [Aureococcus anophagefferens]|nr:hypothetical protein JL722_8400 [Aureococcus anophagefferens]